jgi:hypothetical protein
MGIMLQPEGTLRCKLARQFVPAAICQIMKFFLQLHTRSWLQPEPTFANFRNHQNFFQQSTKTLTMKPQIIPDLWDLQPEVANQQQTK